MSRVILVGGGPAGLVTACRLADGGASVTLLEQSESFGGRARTRTEAGYALNLGPHALYRGGVAARTFAALGVPWRGTPVAPGGFLATTSVLHPLPATPAWLLTSPALSAAGRLAAVRWFSARALGLLPDDEPVADWLAPLPEDARQLALALVRVSTYAHAPERQSARAAARQLTAALRGGVEYLDGGWVTLVDGLRAAATARGVVLRAGTGAQRATADEVVTTAGEVLPADHVVLAVPPATARRLGATVPALTPVRAACLDLGLTTLPDPTRTFALGLDRPLYLSVHTAWARLAPEGGSVLHLARYLAPDDDGHDAIAELEALADRCQPGWRDHVAARFAAPALTVAHALPEAGVTRPGPRSPEGHWLVGDWVRSDALLLDGAVDTANGAAAAILASRRAAA